MKKIIFVFGAVILGAFAMYYTGAFAKLAQYLPRGYGRRLSPAWIQFTEEKIGARDVRQLCQRIRSKDTEEWDVMVLMNEFHGHIGPWSLVGCKMGQRALDLLQVPRFQSITVVSEGGNVPPKGCITDGMMFGCGATVGRGLLKLSGGEYKPAGTFIYEDKAVRLEAKPFVSATIRDSIMTIKAETGGLEYPEYWQRIRAFGLEVWEQWDREEIFEETWVEPTEVAVSEEAMVYAPSDFELARNVPNPFNTATAISFTLPLSEKGSLVELVIYNLSGQKVRTLLRGEVSGGQTTVTWDGRDSFGRQMASGTYVYRLMADGGRVVAAEKMCLLR